jgi:hypothetical protein
MTTRRNFLKNLLKASITIAVAPSILAEASKLEASKQIITMSFNGDTYWFDWNMWCAEQAFMKEQEKKLWNHKLYPYTPNESIKPNDVQ